MIYRGRPWSGRIQRGYGSSLTTGKTNSSGGNNGGCCEVRSNVGLGNCLSVAASTHCYFSNKRADVHQKREPKLETSAISPWQYNEALRFIRTFFLVRKPLSVAADYHPPEISQMRFKASAVLQHRLRSNTPFAKISNGRVHRSTKYGNPRHAPRIAFPRANTRLTRVDAGYHDNNTREAE